MTPELYQQAITRAAGVCECGCKRHLRGREVDHFFGRAKAEETLANVWVLHPDCHYAKTNNSPHRRHWLLKFIAHCGRQIDRLDGGDLRQQEVRHGYAQAAVRAQAKLEWDDAMGPRSGARA